MRMILAIVIGAQQHCAHSSGSPRLDVFAAIADQKSLLFIQAVCSHEIENHPWLRLAAWALVAIIVDAVRKLQLREPALHFFGDGVEVVLGH